jgi:hypothetical protein
MRIRIISLLAVVVGLVAPASALARTTRVVPFKTVAGIPLKLSPAQVRHRLGRPSHTVRVSGRIAEYDYENADMTVEFDTLHHPVLSNFVGVTVGAFSRKIDFHTVHGLHIGSSRAAVRRAFGHRCHWDLGSCAIWQGTPGANGSTSFNLTFFHDKLVEMNNQFVFNDL